MRWEDSRITIQNYFKALKLRIVITLNYTYTQIFYVSPVYLHVIVREYLILLCNLQVYHNLT